MKASLKICADCGKTPLDVNHLFAFTPQPMTLKRPCKTNMVSSKNETIVLRMIYENTFKMFQRLQPHVVKLSVL